MNILIFLVVKKNILCNTMGIFAYIGSQWVRVVPRAMGSVGQKDLSSKAKRAYPYRKHASTEPTI